jgi:Conserved TM helix
MVLVDILANLTTGAVNFLPNLVSAIVLLVIGLVVGKILGRVVKEFLEKVRLDYYVSETHKPAISLSSLFSVIVRWWIYLAFISAALSTQVLGIASLALWIAEVQAFIPRVIGAAVIMVVGYVLAEYIRAHIKKGPTLYGALVGKVLFFLVLYVSIALALPILGISSALISNILLIIIASVGLGVAIALGLGLKDAVSDVSKRYVKKMKV